MTGLRKLKRRDRWRGDLDRFCDQVRSDPFDWGRHNCATFCLAAVKAITGRNLKRHFPGRYGTEKGALKALRKLGFETLGEAAGSVLPQIHPSQAQIGDLIGFESGDAFGHVMGVAIGERVLMVTERGLDSRDRAEAVCAFAVGWEPDA